MKRIIIPLILFLLIFSTVVLGAPSYGNVGPTTEFTGDVGVPSGSGYYMGDIELDLESLLSGWYFSHTEDQLFFGELAGVTLGNLSGVTINAALVLETSDAFALGSATKMWSDLFLAAGAVINFDNGNLTLTHSAGTLTFTGRLVGNGSGLTGVGETEATALTISCKAAEDIDIGEVVYVSGATGNKPQINLADNTHTDKHTFCGIAAETKTSGQTILIRVRGELTTLNTNSFNVGDTLYLSTGGAMVNSAPTNGAVEIIGYVTVKSATVGKIVILHHSAHGIHAPSTDDIVIRMGDSAASNKVYFKDYANAEVGFIDSDGKADFTSLTLDTALSPAEGGTGVANNASSTLTISGNFATTITVTEATGVTFPASGTLLSNAANTIDSDQYVDGSIDHEHLAPDVITGLTEVTSADADMMIMADQSDSWALKKVDMGEVRGAGAGGAGTALDNLAAVAINTTLISDAPDTDSLGDATHEWLNLYIGDAGKIYLGLGQDLTIHRSAANTMTLTASSGVVCSAGLTVAGDLILGANSIGRDADNDIDFETDNRIMFRTNGVDGMEIISSGELDMNANTIGFTLQTGTGDGTTTIDWKLGNKYKFTHGNMAETFTFTAPTNPCSLTLEILEDANGSHDCTWPASVTWLGTEPTWTDGAANKTIIVVFWYNGTTYWGQGTPWES